MSCTLHQILLGSSESGVGCACGTCEGGTNAYKIFVGNPVGTTSLGTPRRRREVNIRIDLQEMG